MIKNIYNLNEFAKQHNTSYVTELPIKVQDQNIVQILTNRFNEYMSLLNKFLIEKSGSDIWDNVKDDLTFLHNSIIKVIENDSYERLKICLDKIEQKWNLLNMMKRELERVDLYRFCSYSTVLTQDKQFYHCPICKKGVNTRFGKADTPLWYLGYSIDVCKYEAHGRGGSLAIFRQIDSTPLTIIDLTQKVYYNVNEDTYPHGACYIFWWLLACCYCYLDSDNHEMTSIFPQLFAKYIKEKYIDVSGIRYYTVRNCQLNPGEETFVNLALFTRDYNLEGYDMNLCGKFKMIDSEQNVTTTM